MSRGLVRGAFWPTPTQEALLRVALGRPEKRIARWEELASVDLRTLEEGSFGLLPLLFQFLPKDGADARMSLLSGIYRSTWYRNQLALKRLDALLPNLRARGIEPVLVAGGAAVLRSYPKLGSRPLPLLEFVIDPRQADVAREVAVSGGWRPAGSNNHRGRFVDAGQRTTLVLHHGVPAAVAGSLDRAEVLLRMRAMARTQEMLDETVLVLDPAHELAFLCGMGARTVQPPAVQWLVDVAMLLTSPSRPAASEAVACARRLQLTEPLRDIVSYLGAVCELQSLDELAQALAGEHGSRRQALAYRLTGARVGRLGGLPFVLGGYLRASPPGVLGTLTGFPAYLAEAWEAESVHDVPRLAWARVRRLCRRRPIMQRR